MYWFLSFLWRRASGAEAAWQPVEAVIAEHPMDYIQRARRANSDREFCLMFFTPIPRDVYLRASANE